MTSSPTIGRNMQTKDIPDEMILNFLADRQGQWTSLWYGYFLTHKSHDGKPVEDVFLAFPPDTPHKVIKSKMKSLCNRGLLGGCPCGCRGDFEITDKGLQKIGRKREKPYTGY